MPHRNLSETASHLAKFRETYSSRGCSIASRDNFVYGSVSKVNDELAGARALAFDRGVHNIGAATPDNTIDPVANLF